MTQTTPERKPCGTCGEEFTVTAAGGMRSHFTDNPDFQAGPDSRKCRGVGQPPAGADAPGDPDGGPQCRLCKHPVELTGNGRARSHLTPEQTPRPCPGGSDFPLGAYPDMVGTTDGLVATISFDCDHREVGACYDCYAEAGSPDAVNQPTMADQLKAAGDEPSEAHEDSRDRWQALNDEWSRQRDDDDTRTEAGRFLELAASGGLPRSNGLSPAERARRDTIAATDHRTPERKAQDARTSELTREAIAVLQQRSPEEKAATAARMDRVASAALGVPLDPALNHQYTDPSGIVWVHNGAAEACEAPDCVTMRQSSEDGLMDVYGRTKNGGVYCGKCDTDNHRCPGCGDSVPHGTVACTDCDRRTMANRIPPGVTEDGRPCHHDDAQFGIKNDRLVCIACGTPCTHPDGFTENDPEDDDGEGRIFTCGLCGLVDPGDELPDDDRENAQILGSCTRCGKPRDGHAHNVPDTGSVSIGDLEFGDHFVRRGVLMRCTSSGYGVVEAVVVEGPMKGRTGELKNPAEQVERTYCRHNWVTEVPPGGVGFAGPGCEYCGDLKETTECPDDKTVTQQPRSSADPARPAPTAKASTKGRSAAVTTDQSAAAAAFLGNGRPAVPAQPGPANQADAAAQFLAGGSGAHGEKETKRDRYGRYLIPHPDTGKETAWTRSTTFAKSISDTYALSQWGLRMALLGATVRPDIVQRAHGKHVKADKKLLDELTADLKDAAGDKVAANLGTSMHSFTELADRAWHSPGGPRSVMDQIPGDCRPMVETYIRLLEETGLEPVPHLIEFTTVVKQYGVAGTSDNCYRVTKPLTLKIGRAEVRLASGEYVIGDKKTGKDLDYGWQEIVIQLATYAQGINTAGVWDRKDEVWEPDPLSRFDKPGTKVRLDAGVVIHLPVDKEAEKQPAVYGVDLESGWNAAVLCERVRAWRKVRNLAGPVMVSEAPQTFAPSRPGPDVVTQTVVRPPTLKERAANVTSKSEASGVWKDAKTVGLSDAEVDELVAAMQDRLRKLSEPGG